MCNYNVYIDEAGDEGFKFKCDRGRGSSKFFVLSAIIVKQELDQGLASLVNELKQILKYQPKDMLALLHFYKMSHGKRKVCVNHLVHFKDYTIVSIVFQKEKLMEPLKVKSVLYNYACKLLLEKVTIFLKSQKAKAIWNCALKNDITILPNPFNILSAINIKKERKNRENVRIRTRCTFN